MFQILALLLQLIIPINSSAAVPFVVFPFLHLNPSSLARALDPDADYVLRWRIIASLVCCVIMVRV